MEEHWAGFKNTYHWEAIMEFEGFVKIPRLSRECLITEKIDGTNAQVYIRVLPDDETMPTDTPIVAVRGNLLIYAGSRTRWITPQDDNYGFAGWVERNADGLALLGEGRHFGEWWGQGIQRKYDMSEKRFSLFNVSRWDGPDCPLCCHVVPTLYRGEFVMDAVNTALEDLQSKGSHAAPGFMKPEGIVVYHTAGRLYFKKTIEKDSEPKSKWVEA
jgi:hypothetical protein